MYANIDNKNVCFISKRANKHSFKVNISSSLTGACCLVLESYCRPGFLFGYKLPYLPALLIAL
jgi:hypothetical protein